MAKISKNAKKLLALTLAGVMTVGTAVPGTAMSSVQEVQAAATDADRTAAIEILKDKVIAAINEDVNYAVMEGISDDTVVNSWGNSLPSALAGVLSEPILVNGNQYVQDGYTLTVASVHGTDSSSTYLTNNTVTDNAWNVSITLTNSNPAYANNTLTFSTNVPVTVYDLNDIMSESGLTEVYPEQTITATENDTVNVNNVTTEVTTIAQKRLDDFISDAGIEGDAPTLTITGAIFSSDKSKWEGTLNLASAYATVPTVEAKTASAEIEAPIRTAESAEDVALKRVADELSATHIKIKLGVEVKKGEDVSSDVADLVTDAIQSAADDAEYQQNDPTLAGAKINEDGTAITGVLTPAAGVNARPIEVNIPIDVVTVETMEVASPSDSNFEVEDTVNITPGSANDMEGAKVILHLNTGNTITIKESYSTPNQGTTTSSGNLSDDVHDATAEETKGITDSSLVKVLVSDLQYAMSARILGDSHIDIVSKDMNEVSASMSVKVGGHYEITDTADLGFETGITLGKVETEDSSIAVATLHDDNEGLDIWGYKEGETLLTVYDENNNARSVRVIVYVNGKIVVKPVVGTEPIYIDASDNKIGFEVDEEAAPLVTDPTNNAFTAEYTTRNGKTVVKITPTGKAATTVAARNANLILTDKTGKLAAGYRIDIDLSKGVTRTFIANNIDSVEFNDKAQKTIENTKFYTDQVGKDVTEDIKFESGDTLKLTTESTPSLVGFKNNALVTTVEVPATDATDLILKEKSGSGYEITGKYCGAEFTTAATVNVLKSFEIKRADLLNNIKTAQGTVKASSDLVSAEFDAAGNLVVRALRPADNAPEKVTVTVNDTYITADIYLSVDAQGTIRPDTTLPANGGSFGSIANSGYLVTRNDLFGYEDGKYTAPVKRDYYIGEKLDITGASYQYAKDGEILSLEITDKMYHGFDSSEVTTSPQTVTFNYAGIGTLAKYDFQVNILAKSTTITADDIALVGANMTAAAYSGDKGLTAVLEDGVITLTATKISQNGTLQITADDGRVFDIDVSVDENGNFTVGSIPFEIHSASVTGEELNLTPYAAEAEDGSIVNAYVADGKVILESAKAGTTTVTVTDREGHKASIFVTVAKDGSMSYTVSPYVAEAWEKGENGDWYYIKDGKRVVSDWVCVQEEDPYNNNEVGDVWYHFGSDGKMQRGWIVDETGWKIYLLDSNGRMMHSQWVNAPAQESLNRPAGLYKLTDDGAVQMNGWAESVTPGIYWFCNAGNGLFEQDNPASWGSEKLF